MAQERNGFHWLHQREEGASCFRCERGSNRLAIQQRQRLYRIRLHLCERLIERALKRRWIVGNYRSRIWRQRFVR